jgi:hypothetical protein
MKKKIIIAILLATLMLNSVLVSAMTTISEGNDDVIVTLISPEDGAEDVHVDSTDCRKVYVKLNVQTDYEVGRIWFLRYEDDKGLGGVEKDDIKENGDNEGVIYWADYNTAYNWYVKIFYDHGHYETTFPSEGYWTFTTREYDPSPTADFTWEEIEVCESMNKIKFNASLSHDNNGIELYKWWFKSFPDDEMLEQKDGKIVEFTPYDFDEYRAILRVYDEYGQMGETDGLFQLKHDLPTLSNPNVDYETGEKGDYFTFSIDYYDKYGHEPEDSTGACVVVIKDPVYNYEIPYDLTPEEPDSNDTTLSATVQLPLAGDYKYKFIVHDQYDGVDPEEKAVNYPDQGWLTLKVKGTPKSVLKFRDGFIAKLLDYFPNAFPLLRLLLKL